MVSGGQDLPPIGCRVVMNATSTLTLLGRRPCQYRAGANAQPAWTSHLTSSSADCCVRMRTSLATSDFLRFGDFSESASLALAQVRGLRLGCKLRFGGEGAGGGLPAAGAKILAILSVNHCILALKVMPHTLFVGFCAITYRLCD